MQENQHLDHEEIYPGLYINSKPPEGCDVIANVNEKKINLDDVAQLMGKIEVAKRVLKLKPYLN